MTNQKHPPGYIPLTIHEMNGSSSGQSHGQRGSQRRDGDGQGRRAKSKNRQGKNGHGGGGGRGHDGGRNPRRRGGRDNGYREQRNMAPRGAAPQEDSQDFEDEFDGNFEDRSDDFVASGHQNDQNGGGNGTDPADEEE